MIKVYLVECVDAELEHPVGLQTALWTVRPRAEAENVALSVAEPITAYDLSKLLNDAYQEMKGYQQPGPPLVLHIDAHGNERGIVMRSGELFSWEKLAGFCEQLSLLNNIQTILIMGACKGAYALEMLEFCKRAPFFCLFGPKQNIDSLVLQAFYRDFYTLLMNHRNITIAAEEVMAIHREQIYFATSFHIFELAYKKYFSPEMSRYHLLRRKRIAKKLKKLPITTQEKEIKLSLLRNTKLLNSIVFNPFRQKFLLIDIYPQNEERFSFLTIESILSGSRAV